MSDLLNAASLIMIPSGYSEDKVYSAVPTDGSGDLSFTRASNGTRINSAGLVEVTPWNLLEQSETFDNAYWTQNNCTVTANNTTAPNGTNTADLITSTGTTETGIFILLTFSGQNTWSIYAKKGTGRYLFFNTNTPIIAAKFDLQDGVIVGTPSAGATPSIESVGNGWYRCSITSSTSTNRFTAFITNNTTTSDLSSSVGLSYYLWGAQVNQGALKPYFPTTDRLNVPRLTYQNGGGGCPSLLLEKQSTNLVNYSEQFDNAYWNLYQATITANDTISPDGTQNADKFVSTSAPTNAVVYKNFSSISAGAQTISVFFKAGTAIKGFLQIYDGTTSFNATYNTSTGLVESIAGGATASMQNMGNGWWRCVLTATTLGATHYMDYGIYSASVGAYGYVWGAQFETQSSYPTSYIPTTSASATRVVDRCLKTSASSLIGQTSGVLFGDLIFDSAESVNRMFSITGADWNSNGSIRFDIISNQPEIYARKAGADIGSGSASYTINKGQRIKFAVVYTASNMKLFVDGAQRGSTVTLSTTPPTCSEVYINELGGGFSSTSQNNQGSKWNQVVLFPTSLTDAECISLTTI